MINLSYTVAGQLIEPASVPQYLVADTVGVYQVAFTFDADWADMGEKMVVFRNPQVIDPDYRDVPVEFPLDANGQALVPAALLDPGKLFIGVYGTNSTQQFPTIWAPPLQVVPGASPGVEPSDDPALGTVIRTIPQTLTEEEKAQARENIGTNEIPGGTPGNLTIIDNNENIADSGVSKDNLLLAPQLSSHIYAEDQTPYLYRQTGGGVEAGTREYDSIVGGSVVHNQMIKDPQFAYATAWSGRYCSTAVADGVATLTVTSAGTDRGLTGNDSGGFGLTYRANHKIWLAIDAYLPAESMMGLSISGGYSKRTIVHPANTWVRQEVIWTSPNAISGNGKLYALLAASLAQNAQIKYRNALAIDLTEMFGPAVADRLYAMETAQQGSGIALLKRMFPEDTYAYTAEPSLLSAMPTGHKTVGFNQFNKDDIVNGYISNVTGALTAQWQSRATDFIPVFGGETYFVRSDQTSGKWGAFYDAEKNFISGFSGYDIPLTAPANAKYIRLTLSYINSGNPDTFCVSRSDPIRNGQYEPYTEHTYPLAGIELRGVWVVNSDGSISCDGDTYVPDGTVTRRYGTITLTGDEAWTTVNTGLVSVGLPDMMPAPAGGPGNPHGIAEGYVTYSTFADVRAVHSNTYDKAVVFGSGYIGSVYRLYIRDNTNAPSVDDWKSYLSTHPLTVVYELATPTVETATPYDALQVCDPLGTEEYVDERTVPVPVGHITKYPVDQVRKLDGLPSDFSTLIAPTEKTYTATRAYAVKDLVIVDNQLYRVTSAISSGNTITPGTNCTAVTVASLIKSLI